MGAFALQIFIQSGDAHCGIDGMALWLEPLAIRGSEQAAARVGADVGALSGELRLVDGHHVAVAGVEKGWGSGLGDRIAKHTISHYGITKHGGGPHGIAKQLRGQYCAWRFGRQVLVGVWGRRLSCHGPIALVAAILETSNDMA